MFFNYEQIKSDKQRYMVGIVLNDKELNIDEQTEDEFKENGFNILCISKINNAVRFFLLLMDHL